MSRLLGPYSLNRNKAREIVARNKAREIVALDEDTERDWSGEGGSVAILAWNSLGSLNKLAGGSSGELAQRQNFAAALRRLKYIICGADRGKESCF